VVHEKAVGSPIEIKDIAYPLMLVTHGSGVPRSEKSSRLELTLVHAVLTKRVVGSEQHGSRIRRTIVVSQQAEPPKKDLRVVGLWIRDPTKSHTISDSPPYLAIIQFIKGQRSG
jgi:hypothetical protein